MTPSESHPDSSPEFEFSPFGFHKGAAGRQIDLIKFVIATWKPLALGGALGLLGGVALYLILGPVYAASTQVLVSQKAQAPVQDRQVNRYGDRGDHVRLLQTDLIIEGAYKNHGLDQIPQLAGAYDPLKEVSEALKVSRSSGQENSFDNILEISYEHPDKKIAKAVVQAIVDAYKDYLIATRDDNAREVYDSLIGRQQELETEIRRLEEKYKDFYQNAPVFLKSSAVVTINGQPTVTQNEYETELTSIEKAQQDNLVKQSRVKARLATLDRKLAEKTPRELLEFWVLHAMSQGTAGAEGGASGGGGGGASAAMTASNEKNQLDQQLLAARLLEHKLLQSLGPDHANVKNARQQVQSILDFYRRQGLTPPELSGDPQTGISSRSAALGTDIVAAYQDTLNEQLRELQLDNENLEVLHNGAKGRAKSAKLFEVEDQRQKDEIATKKKQLEDQLTLLSNYDITREQEGYRMQQISAVRLERSLKRVLKIVGMCGVLGAVLVFCLAYFREWYDTRLKTLEEVRMLTGTSLLGTLPTFISSNDADRLAEQRGVSPKLCYFHRPGSRDAEAFRSLRTTLYVTVREGQRVLQVSSAEPGDGKSTTAANLAVAIAQSGKAVLLIDGDLRRPTQHQLFHVSQEVGLSEVLQHELEWRNAVRPSVVDGLSLMTSGHCPENPAELLSGDVLPRLLAEARKEYDFVIVDSPPVLAVSDPCNISPHADGMLLVVRMQKTKRATARRLQETLQAHGVRVVGTIANDFTKQLAADSGYDYDTYGTYYSRSAPEKAGTAPRAPAGSV